MGKIIPIAQASSAASACSSGATSASSSGASSPTGISSGACSSAGSCSSASSCSSAGGVVDSNDPSVKLAQEGWILRTTIGEPRLSEVVENYRAMGFEVHVERFGTASADTQDGETSCTTCYDAADKSDASQAWGSVYVRPGRPQNQSDELF